MDRQIVCFTVPALEIALARLKDPSLRNRPIGVASWHTSRALLREVSSEAKTEGIQAGMPVECASQLCPSLRLLPPDPARIRDAQQALLNVILSYAPAWEPVQPGLFLMDLTGTTHLFGPACDTAARIQQDVAHQYHLHGMTGVGSNKLVARTAASLIQPSQLYEVRSGSECAFMAPLTIRTAPVLDRPGMRKILDRLDELNLQTFGDLTEISLEALHLAVGTWASKLSRWAQGIDSSLVLARPAQPRLEASLRLEPDDIDDRVLLGRLSDLLEQLCRTLRRQRRVAHGLTLTLHYSDQVTITRQRHVGSGTYWEADLAPHLCSLFQRCLCRRICIRRMTLGMTGLAPLAEQLSLFDAGAEDRRQQRLRSQKLTLALDHLRERYGKHVIRYGRGMKTRGTM